MVKAVMATIMLLFLMGCSATVTKIIPDNPRVSFGKKCSVTDEGQIAYSWLWIYNKEAGLKADKQTCEKIAD